MRKMKVKRPEKETATTAREEGHDSSLSGAPSATPEHVYVNKTEIRWQTAKSYRKLRQHGDNAWLFKTKILIILLATRPSIISTRKSTASDLIIDLCTNDHQVSVWSSSLRARRCLTFRALPSHSTAINEHLMVILLPHSIQNL